jgi:hypothetical protein
MKRLIDVLDPNSAHNFVDPLVFLVVGTIWFYLIGLLLRACLLKLIRATRTPRTVSGSP